MVTKPDETWSFSEPEYVGRLPARPATFEEAYKKALNGPFLPYEETQKRFRLLSPEDARAILNGYLEGKAVLGWVMTTLIEECLWLTRDDLREVLRRTDLDPFSRENITTDAAVELRMAGRELAPILMAAERRLDRMANELHDIDLKIEDLKNPMGHPTLAKWIEAVGAFWEGDDCRVGTVHVYLDGDRNLHLDFVHRASNTDISENPMTGKYAIATRKKAGQGGAG